MKYKYILIILAIAIIFPAFKLIQAEDLDTEVKSDVKIEINSNERDSDEDKDEVEDNQIADNQREDVKATSSKENELEVENDNVDENETEVEIESTSSRDREDSIKTQEFKNNNEKEEDDNASSTKESDDDNESEAHRSVVATFVQSLLKVADKEKGIGDEVRVIAKTQNDLATTTAEAIVKVEERSFIKTFLFGSDYKNLGVIRKDLNNTNNNIDRLKALLEKTTNAADQAELNVQIKNLEDEQIKIETYVKTHEDTFSLFGWLAKWFSK